MPLVHEPGAAPVMFRVTASAYSVLAESRLAEVPVAAMFAIVAPLKVRLSTVSEARRSRVAPALMTKALAACALAVPTRRSVPPLTVVVPAYVFAPESVRTPLPFFVRPRFPPVWPTGPDISREVPVATSTARASFRMTGAEIRLTPKSFEMLAPAAPLSKVSVPAVPWATVKPPPPGMLFAKAS